MKKDNKKKTNQISFDNEISESAFTDSKNNIVETKELRLDTLKPKHLEEYAENIRIINLVENGYSVAKAIKHLGIKRSRRAVQDRIQKFRELGKAGLIDQRALVMRIPRVLTDEVKEIILSCYFEASAAGYRAVGEMAAVICRQKNLPVPSESSITKFLSEQNSSVKFARKGALGIRQWQRASASVVTQQKTSFSNELWQGDDTPPEIWVRKKIKGNWKAHKVHISVLLDDYSRAVPGILVSTKPPDAWTVSLLFRQAMLPDGIPGSGVCGIPFNAESDRGANWISKSAQNMLQAVGINAVIDAPYYPNLKGKVERFFQHLDSNCLRKLPGHFAAIGSTEGAAQKHVHELLTLEQLKDEIFHWITNVYHQKVHSATGRKPLELWQETVRFRAVENEDDLNILLLKDDTERTIQNLGLRFAINQEKHTYWSPSFEQLNKRRVRLRYNPESTESVYLYCASTGEFLCEAWDLRAENPKYTYQDIKLSRHSEKQNMRSMHSRLKTYYKDVSENDRVSEQQKEWAESRELAEQLPEPEVNNEAEDEINDLVELLRRRDQQR